MTGATPASETQEVPNDGEAAVGEEPEIANLDDDSVRVDLELARIRERRENPGKSFLVNSIVPRTFDDYTLVVGLISGIVFFGSIFVASSGLIWGDSIVVDEALSGTVLDPSDCDDKRDEIWFETWVNQDQDLRIRSHNAESSSTALFITLWNQTEGYALSLESESAIGGIGDLSETVKSQGLQDGDYLLLIQFRSWTDSPMDLSNQSFEELSSRVQQDPPDFESSKNFDITIETVKSASLLGSGESHKKMETFDDEPRACFTVQRMGGWGWALMFAEWVGGRETAMLTGGSAQVPPWYMAMVSLGMSIFFLCVQYPLMHRLYHRDVDDLLSSEQMSRLIEATIGTASEKLQIEPEYSLLKIQDRAISVDVFLPYKMTRRTIVNPIDVKSSIIKAILNEFRIFGEMRPLQIKTVCTDSMDGEESTGERWGEGHISFHLPDDYSEEISLAEDYSQFFVRMGRFGKLEEVFRESMSRWFKKHGVVDYGSAIMADEDAVFVRVIYRPKTKFAYFLFKPTYQHLQGDLREQMQSDLKDLLEGRVLVVSARNEKSTMADRAVAGRVEQGSQELTGEAMVAKRGGIPGALLQNPFMGDILSSVEYVAHKNRARIDRYGFWGLIVFVWIPFMASGVLVGAMLGLVARMRFQRVLAACFIGGTAASVTWAYTARGIIEAMERYHAEALIPFVILLAIVFTWLKIRDNKRHRREELFRDSMSFFAGAPES